MFNEWPVRLISPTRCLEESFQRLTTSAVSAWSRRSRFGLTFCDSGRLHTRQSRTACPANHRPPRWGKMRGEWFVRARRLKRFCCSNPLVRRQNGQHGRAVPREITEPRPCLPASSTAQFGVLSGCACTKWQNPFDDVTSRICRCGQFFFLVPPHPP